jgi:hypothetical protein
MHSVKNRTALSLTALLLLAAAPANAAKCKYQTDTVHSITGEPVRWSKWASFTLTTGAKIVHSAVVEGDRKYVGLRVPQRWSHDQRPTKEILDGMFSIPAGAKLMLKLDDDSIIELHTESEVIADADYGVHSSRNFPMTAIAVVKYALDDQAIAALTANRLTHMRLQTNNGDMDFTFGKKGAKKQQDTLACLK